VPPSAAGKTRKGDGGSPVSGHIAKEIFSSKGAFGREKKPAPKKKKKKRKGLTLTLATVNVDKWKKKGRTGQDLVLTGKRLVKVTPCDGGG